MNLPEGWLPLDLSNGQIPAQIRDLIDARVEQDPQASAYRGQIEQQLRAAIRIARSKDMAFAAILATFTADGLPIAASLALTRHRAPDGADAARILAELGDQSTKHNTLIELPYVGTVVRSEYLDRITMDDASSPGRGAHADVAVFQYFLRMSGRGDIVVATGVTPTLPLRAQFGALFDAIISTFQFVDETD
jgi:hypothetical protein